MITIVVKQGLSPLCHFRRGSHHLEKRMTKIKGGIALVKGGSPGLGEATGERLARTFSKVYGTGRRGASAGLRWFQMPAVGSLHLRAALINETGEYQK
jgi:NAD(P)-dependent dehydrogenase (short-subunit alcohol dehydrogenase family)